jgi:predicted ATPase/DNA-binding CsgD family transcriptional regulator
VVASATWPPLGSAPLPRTRLIGREAERAAARSFLLNDALPLLTMTGPGGVGKTRLALAIAQEVLSAFADGMVWVDLAPLADASLVPATVAAALRVTTPPDGSLTDALVAHLRAAQCLLLLDNCEHVLAAAAEVVSVLLAGCPALQVLATSRAPLRVRAEQALPVPPLAVPAANVTALADVQDAPAVALFVQRAQAAAPQFAMTAENAGAVAALCQRLDGLPLALELAAARTVMLAPAALLTLLREHLGVLGTGPRDAPDRQHTLHAAIAWSYALLAPEEQTVFRHLAVFAGGWTPEAAAAVCGLPLPTMLDRLNTLVDQSLIVPHQDSPAALPRFTMLETLRAFGLAQLRERGEDDAARDRHAAYFHAFIASLDLHHAMPGGASWFGPVVREEDNLRQALTRFAARGNAFALNDLTAALDLFWLTRSQYAEDRFWLEQAIACDTELPPLVRARSRGDAGFMYTLHGDYAAAAPLLDEALALARAGDDSYLLAEMLISAGNLAQLQGDLVRAQAYAVETERVARAIGPSVPNAVQLAAVALGMQAEIARLSGDRVTAITRYVEGVRLHRLSGGTWFLSLDLIELGLTQVCAGDAMGATAHLVEALARSWRLHEDAVLTHERGEDLFFASALCGLATVAAATGQPRAAARLLGATDALGSRTPSATYAERRNQEPAAWCLDQLRDTLEPPTLAALRQMGRSMTIDQAVALAREVATAVLGAERVEELWRAAGAPDPGSAPAFPGPGVDGGLVSSRTEENSDLSFREQEVLALLCQRLTDAEIAARLFLSPRTVGRHVGNILSKLGAANRREAAALAARQNRI